MGLLVLGALAAAWVSGRGYTLYYGDAEAHLNIARRIVDSRTPGYEQIGTVWLPLPHVLMLPFVHMDSLWYSGLAGVIPAVLAFAAAGVALFATVRRLFDANAPAVCAALLLGLNPNLLYLQSTPMTEPLLLASLLGMLYFSIVCAQSRSGWAALGAGICSAAASLTRYEGWFLIPFVALFLFLRCGLRPALIFSAVAGAMPAYWLAHNLWFYGNPLEFYNGPYSAKAMNDNYPGQGDWTVAARYYYAAVKLCAGAPLVLIGVAGLAAALWKRAWWPVTLLGLIPAFYILSMYSSGTPIFVPHLWPNSYYNTRYGVGTIPLLALGGAALVALLPFRLQKGGAIAVLVTAMLPWIVTPGPDNWITWKESQVNSEARRAWTNQAAQYLRTHYRPGAGILFSWGDLTGVLREARIPLAESLHEGNGPHAAATLARPDLFLWEEWAMAMSADPVSWAVTTVGKTGPYYSQQRLIHFNGGPVIEIHRRTHDNRIHKSARSAE